MEKEALTGMTRNDLRARGDRDLAERLLGEAEIRKAIERFEKEVADHGARRQLLATAMRLTAIAKAIGIDRNVVMRTVTAELR